MPSSWVITTVAICSYGFIKEIRPLTPFIFEYLLQDKNFTLSTLEGKVFPFSTYSHLVFLIPILILTDFLRYKPLIVSESLAYIFTWILLIWGYSVGHMQLMQVCYGWAVASEVAYYAYIYAAVEDRHYQKATSFVRAAVLSGRSIAYISAQVIMWAVGDFPVLNYITLTAMFVILIVAFMLPKPWRLDGQLASYIPQEQIFRSGMISEELEPMAAYCANEGTVYSVQTFLSRSRAYFPDLFAKFKRSYRVGFVLKWSLWWALASCGYFQVGNYIQARWADLYRQDETAGLYNGITESVSTLVGAIVAVLMQFLHVNWAVVGELTLGLLSAVDAVLLIVISQTSHLVLSHVFYVVFCVLYQMLITVATYNIALKIESSSHGLVFGCNTFIALAVQTVLTLVVVDQSLLHLDIKQQFFVYGIYHAVISLVFLGMGVVVIARLGAMSPAQFWDLVKAVPVEHSAVAVVDASTVDGEVTADSDETVKLQKVSTGSARYLSADYDAAVEATCLRGAEVFTTSNG